MNQLIIGEPHPVAIAGINKLFTWILRTLLGIEYIYICIYMYIYIQLYLERMQCNEMFNQQHDSWECLKMGFLYIYPQYVFICIGIMMINE